MNDCAMLSFAMATMMMAACTAMFSKLGKRSCAEGALLSLIGVGVGFVALTCLYPGFQHMVEHLPIISNIIGSNGIIALAVDCLAFAATATLAVMALAGPCKLKASKPMDLYKCFVLGMALALGAAYMINSGCIVKHSHPSKEDRRK